MEAIGTAGRDFIMNDKRLNLKTEEKHSEFIPIRCAYLLRY